MEQTVVLVKPDGVSRKSKLFEIEKPIKKKETKNIRS